MELKFTPDNIYLVGGSVRDYLLKKKVNDYDFVISCSKEDFENQAQTFLKKNFNKKGFLIGKQFPPTMRVVINKKTYIDVTLMCGNINEDAVRRDFTINALYLNLKNKNIVDPLSGKIDLKNKVIKCCSEKSFDNDPLRLLRAFRISGQLHFKLNKETYINIVRKKALIHKVATERIREEIEKIFLLDNRFIIIKHLEKSGLLFEIFPELKEIKGLEQKKFHKFDVLNHSLNILKYIPENICEFEKIVYCYTALFHDLGKSKTNYMHTKFSSEISKAIFKRLKLPIKMQKVLINIIENHMKILQISLNNVKENTLKKLVFNHWEIIPYLVNFAKFEAKTKNIVEPEYYMVCDKLVTLYNDFLVKKDFIFNLVTGKEILDSGVKQGKMVGELLEKIRFYIFRDNITSKNDALKLLNSLKKQII